MSQSFEIVNLRALKKLFGEKKKQFEDDYSEGKPYEEVNQTYLELKALQNELNRRKLAEPNKEAK